MHTREQTTSPPGQAQPDDPRSHHHVADAFASVRRQLRQVQEFINFYLLVQADRLKLAVRKLIIAVAAGILLLIAGAAFLVTAAVQVCIGIAHLLTIAFGGRAWLGDLVTGVVIWIVVAGGTYLGISSIIKKSRKATMEKYEQLRQQQRTQFGRDVGEAANAGD